MEIMDIRSEDILKTGRCTEFASADETASAFATAREVAVNRKRAEFLLDLHGDDGRLLDTIFLDTNGFKAVIGEDPLTVEDYAQFDHAYYLGESEDHFDKRDIWIS